MKLQRLVEKEVPKGKQAEYQRRYREKNLARVRAKARAYYHKNKERVKAYKAANRERIAEAQRRYLQDPLKREMKAKRVGEWGKAHPEKRQAYKRKNLYGISADQYAALLKAQDGRCATCRTTFEESGRPLGVDHDHETGKVRGLLCRSCNLALGGARDDVGVLQRMLDYVVYHKRAKLEVSA